MNLLSVIQPELILVCAACVLFLLGVIDRAGTRRLCAWIALAALVGAFGWQIWSSTFEIQAMLADSFDAFHVATMANFIRLLASGVGMILVLLAWPSDARATRNSALDFGTEAGEFFALMLLAIAGIFVVADANDIIVLFLGLELASIPTYIMVSVSRSNPVAQEAGVKYFFLGAMSAAIMLFGFSYLYGTTGLTNLTQLADFFGTAIAHHAVTNLQTLAIVVLILGFAFKMAAFPLHFYAGDVYQGAATPVTAFLSFVPKTSGLIALIKILFMFGGGDWPATFPPQIAKLIWILAVCTMSVGNVLGLLQTNVKRILAYSSVAHSGYLLVGIATMVGSGDRLMQVAGLAAALFYLASYGIMNAAAFGVLMLLPAKPPPKWDRQAQLYAGGSAETLDDIAGAGIDHLWLGMAMAIACFSLTGLPLTIGFFGKFYLIQAAWRAGFSWLIVLMMINAAISAAYYLRIVATMFLRPEPIGGFDANVPSASDVGAASGASMPRPPIVAISLSCLATLIVGIYFPATALLNDNSRRASAVDPSMSMPRSNFPVTPPTFSAPASTKITAQKLPLPSVDSGVPLRSA